MKMLLMNLHWIFITFGQFLISEAAEFRIVSDLQKVNTSDELKRSSSTESASTRSARLTEFPRETPPNDPRFVTYNNTVVETQVGATAILHCKTSSTTGGLVSWIRKRDYQILTVGLQSHSSDERFSINYVHWDWQLHVRYVQPRDGGAYECQVSSDPPASIFVHLDVVEAEAEILGSPEKHVQAGSILRLVCILHHTTEAPAYVFWYRGRDMINYNEEQSIVVESDEHTSVLLVTKASRKHSGNYSCVPSNAKPASILVHVLTGRNGEYPAAMQHGESEAKKSASLSSLCLLLSLILSLAATSQVLAIPLKVFIPTNRNGQSFFVKGQKWPFQKGKNVSVANDSFNQNSGRVFANSVSLESFQGLLENKIQEDSIHNRVKTRLSIISSFNRR